MIRITIVDFNVFSLFDCYIELKSMFLCIFINFDVDIFVSRRFI
jgi:hypothetical protein